MSVVKNEKTGFIKSSMGRELRGGAFGTDLYKAKRSAVGSTSRRKVASEFVRSALKSLGTIESTTVGSHLDVHPAPALGVNTWVIPYLEVAVALLEGEEVVW